MQREWRSSLRQQIEEAYIEGPETWFDMNISPSGMLNLTIVSDRFKDIPLPERREQIQQMLRQCGSPASGFLSPYTVEEAEMLGLSQPSSENGNAIYSWHDLASWAANIQKGEQKSNRKSQIPRTISFYSFKGGVGRTTALTHVAALLAMRGRRVVAVDLD